MVSSENEKKIKLTWFVIEFIATISFLSNEGNLIKIVFESMVLLFLLIFSFLAKIWLENVFIGGNAGFSARKSFKGGQTMGHCF